MKKDSADKQPSAQEPTAKSSNANGKAIAKQEPATKAATAKETAKGGGASSSNAKRENKAENQAGSQGFNLSQFINETKEELSKVVWPSRQQLFSESLAVVAMVGLSASLIYLVDNFLRWGSHEIFK